MGFDIGAMIEEVIHTAIHYSAYLFEMCCLVVMLWGGFRAMQALILRRGYVEIRLSHYMNMALLFKLGAEIIRLTLVRTLQELLLVAGIVVLHGAISLIIHLEDSHRKTMLHKAPGQPDENDNDDDDDNNDDDNDE